MQSGIPNRICNSAFYQCVITICVVVITKGEKAQLDDRMQLQCFIGTQLASVISLSSDV